MESLCVLYLINSLGPGGAERSLSELAPFYLGASVRPVVVCLRKKADGVEGDLRASGVVVRHLPAGSVARRVAGLRRMLLEEPFDLVHTTLFEADVLGRIAAAGTNVPVLTSLVNTSYDPVRLEDPNVKALRLQAARAIDGWTARRLTTHFHAITRAVREAAVGALGIPTDRVTVIERGRDPERLGRRSEERRRRSRRLLGLSATDEVVVTVGRQEYQKGQRHLLEAAAELARSRQKLAVLIVGRRGHASPDLVALRNRLGLSGRVRFLGLRRDVPDVLAAADVFAFPSLYEGLGGAVIEAMALELPVVASDVPALREVVEHGRSGWLVQPGDPGALAEALGRVLDDAERSSCFGERARQLFEERFTIERSARRMIELYRRVAHSAPSRHHAPARRPVPSRQGS